MLSRKPRAVVRLAGLGCSRDFLDDVAKRAEGIFEGLISIQVFDLGSKPDLKGFLRLRAMPYKLNRLSAKLKLKYAMRFRCAASPESFLALASSVADITGADCAVVVAPIRSYQVFLGEVFGVSDHSGIRYPKAAFVPLMGALERCPSYEVFVDRSSKLIAHEVAHVLGLKDCFSSCCIMKGRGGPEALDSVPPSFCAKCFFKLLHPED